MGLQVGDKFWRCIIDQNPNPVLHCQLNFTIQSAASSHKTFHDFKLGAGASLVFTMSSPLQ